MYSCNLCRSCMHAMLCMYVLCSSVCVHTCVRTHVIYAYVCVSEFTRSCFVVCVFPLHRCSFFFCFRVFVLFGCRSMFVHSSIHVCSYCLKNTDIRICVFIYTYAYIYIYMCIGVGHVYICVYIHIYTGGIASAGRTHAHKHTPSRNNAHVYAHRYMSTCMW